MERNYITITQDDIDAKIVENLHSREMELMSYDFERAGHEQAITNLGDIKWTEDNAKYKGLTRDVMIFRAQDDGLDSTAIGDIANLLALDVYKLNLEAVKVETAKSERHYDSLLAALPEGAQRDTALTTFTATQAAKAGK